MRSICLFILVALCLSCKIRAEQDTPLLEIYSNKYPLGDSLIIWTCPVFAYYGDSSVIRKSNWEDVVAELERGIASKERMESGISTVQKYNGGQYKLTGESDPSITMIKTGSARVIIFGNWEAPNVYTDKMIDKRDVPSVNRAEEERWRSLPNEIREFLRYCRYSKLANCTSWIPNRYMLTFDRPLSRKDYQYSMSARISKMMSGEQGKKDINIVVGAALIDGVGGPPDKVERVRVVLNPETGEVRHMTMSPIFPGQQLHELHFP